MTSIQKVIKYLAIAFAIFLVITIISGILGGLYAFSAILGFKQNNEIKSSEMLGTAFENANIKVLDIDVNYTNLTIKRGDSLKVETNNKDIKCKQNNQKIEVKEKKHNWFFNNEKLDLIIYIPENLEFEKVEISNGAGRIEIETLKSKVLELELGAGETKIENLNVSGKCDIEGGAGKVDILSGAINNLDLDMGVGEINLSSMITGRSEIDAGIGNLNIDLQIDRENYTIRVDKGIGTVKVDGKSLSDGEVFGNGTNYIQVDGGIGNIRIDFRK